jgi:hypothetical protein
MLCLLHLGPRFNPLKIDCLLDRLCFHLIILLVVCGSVPPDRSPPPIFSLLSSFYRLAHLLVFYGS